MKTSAIHDIPLRSMEGRLRFVLENSFVLTQAHLGDISQIYLAQNLEDTTMGSFGLGPSTIKQNMVRVILARTDIPEDRAIAHAVRLLVSAVLENKLAEAAKASPEAKRALELAVKPIVSCFLVMFDDVALQERYERSTRRPDPSNRASLREPEPFYTMPFVRGRFVDGAFDQSRRLLSAVWSRPTGSARVFPYRWNMDAVNWDDAGTIAALNRVWGYWMARNGYASRGEYLGPWSRVERNYVVTLITNNRDIHDLDVVDGLNDFLNGRTVEVAGKVIQYMPRGVLGLRRMIVEHRILPWRVDMWSKEFEHDEMRLEWETREASMRLGR